MNEEIELKRKRGRPTRYNDTYAKMPLSIPKKWIELLDSFIDNIDYVSRNDLIIKIINRFLKENKKN